jgi:hypothetical protein
LGDCHAPLVGRYEWPFPLFLLFLQEIYSKRNRVCRRNPGVLTLAQS